MVLLHPLASSTNTHTLGFWMFLEINRHTPLLAWVPVVLSLNPSPPESFLLWDLGSNVPWYDGFSTLHMTQPSPPMGTLALFPALLSPLTLSSPDLVHIEFSVFVSFHLNVNFMEAMTVPFVCCCISRAQRGPTAGVNTYLLKGK